MLILSDRDLHSVLAPEACEQAMAAALAAQERGEATTPLRSVIRSSRNNINKPGNHV